LQLFALKLQVSIPEKNSIPSFFVNIFINEILYLTKQKKSKMASHKKYSLKIANMVLTFPKKAVTIKL